MMRSDPLLAHGHTPLPTNLERRGLVLGASAWALGLAGCASAPGAQPAAQQAMVPSALPYALPHSLPDAGDPYPWLNRLSWGANASSVAHYRSTPMATYLAQQLRPGPAPLPGPASSQIAAMTITQRPLGDLVTDMEQRRKAMVALTNNDEKLAAQHAYQQELNRLGREAATRHVLRALYSPRQIQEQMTWFWMNHFSVHQFKANLRVTVGDYEDTAVRPHALGPFRTLLTAVAQHPAMLLYLDNAHNAAGHVNENYARELMELHTLGVDGGYSQHDVQELARVLTGVGVAIRPEPPRLRPALQGFYVRQGLFEFNPARHDFGHKEFLGQPLRSQGLGELHEALERLCRSPATARHISRKLVQYWLADEPPPALVERMAQVFLRSDGDIAQTLHALLASPEFAQGGGHKFKDPMHYVVSAVRLAYDDKPILNANPILYWLSRMGEPLYGRATPDGYPVDQASWASSGQMATRFEIAKAIGSGSAGLFKSEGAEPQERPAFPQLANALYFEFIRKTLSANTRQALDQAGSPQEWNSFFLSSPEMMNR